MYFSKCYSSTPMTSFTILGLSLGSSAVADAYSHYNREEYTSSGSDALFSVLENECGYKTAAAMVSEMNYPFYQKIILGKLLSIRKSIHLKGIEWDVQGLEAFLADAKLENRNFALYLYNCIDTNHCSMNIDSYRKYRAMDMAEVQEDVMRKADSSVQRFMKLLTQMELLENTTIVLFGDHGWGVARDRFGEIPCSAGVMVSVEQTRIPLFFYNSPLGVGCTNKLATLHDLRETILGMLYPERVFPRIEGPGSGIDLAKESHDVVVCQNKGVLQNPNAREHESRKSYAVVDGSYRLIVTELNSENTEGGMELYFEALDHGQNMDLLTLFTFDDKGNITGLDVAMPKYEGITEYPLFNNPLRLMELSRIYERLRTHLMKIVSQKEEAALLHSSANPFLFNKESFNVAASKRLRRRGGGLGQSKFDQRIKKLVKNKEQIVLYGAGANGRQIWTIFEFYGIMPACFMDKYLTSSDFSKNPEVTVLTAEEVSVQYPSAIVVICSPLYKVDREMSEQCKKFAFRYLSFFKDLLQMPLSYD